MSVFKFLFYFLTNLLAGALGATLGAGGLADRVGDGVEELADELCRAGLDEVHQLLAQRVAVLLQKPGNIVPARKESESN